MSSQKEQRHRPHLGRLILLWAPLVIAFASAYYAASSANAAKRSAQSAEYWTSRQYLPQLKVTCGIVGLRDAREDERSNAVLLTSDRARIYDDYTDLNQGLVNASGLAPEDPSDALRCVLENAGEKPIPGGVIISKAQSLPFHPDTLSLPFALYGTSLESTDQHTFSLPFHALLPGEKEPALIVNYSTRKLFIDISSRLSTFGATGGIYDGAGFVNSPSHGDFVIHGVHQCDAWPRRHATGTRLVRETCFELWKYHRVIGGAPKKAIYLRQNAVARP